MCRPYADRAKGKEEPPGCHDMSDLVRHRPTCCVSLGLLLNLPVLSSGFKLMPQSSTHSSDPTTVFLLRARGCTGH